MRDFISVDEALQYLEAYPFPKRIEKIDLNQASGYILATPILADRDFPPYDRVTMDGIAVQWRDNEPLPSWRIEGIAKAGERQFILSHSENAVEAMTGAVLPVGTDTVIRYEDLVIDNGQARLVDNVQITRGQNIHTQGSDRTRDSVIVQVGKILSPAEIAIAATVGLPKMSVFKMPKVVVISTGDELVAVHEEPLLHQIRSSNSSMIQAFCNTWKISCTAEHIKDDPNILSKRVGQLLEQYDVLIFSGGSSMGKYDFVPSTLQALGVEKVFYKVRQRPGKPLWFGHLNRERFVFALPGNPVSAMVCFRYYFQHWLLQSFGLITDQQFGQLTNDVQFTPELTYFLPFVQKFRTNAIVGIQPVPTNGSGDHSSLTNADGFVRLPADKNHFEKGESYPIIYFR